MAGKSDFTPVEWSILTELPVRIVASAITADPKSGIGAMLEQVVGLTQLSQGAMERPKSNLVQEVFEVYKDNGEGEAKALELSDKWVEDLIPETILRASQASEILTGRASTAETVAYSTWLLETAQAVCAAAKSGGTFLGIGGKRITDAEREFLQDLESAFWAAIPPAE